MTATWDELVSTAVVGTERRAFSADRLAPLAGVTVEGSEAAVLAGAAVLGAYRRAGHLPEQRPTADLPAPAPDDPRPTCSDTAAQLLGFLLDGTIQAIGGRDELLARWLRACARAGRRPPDRLLVALLDLGTARPPLRADVVAATGARGAWLGRANPDWGWTVDATAAPADQWATGTRTQRVGLLRWLRTTDRAAARELLRSTWPTESAPARSDLLATLWAGYDQEDEPFLEDALDDRSAAVRTLAASLLDGLPQSRRAGRMAARSLPLVRREGRSKGRLAVSLPDDLDAAARRDGVTDTREPGKGVRAGWLAQLVAGTPLDAWERHLGADPQEAVALARDQPEVLAGWRRAAARQRNARWAAALLDRSLDPDLLAVLPPGHAAERLDGALRGKPARPEAVLPALAAVPGPWPAALSGRALAWVRTVPDGLLAAVLDPLADRLDPSVLPDVEDWIAHASSNRLKQQVRQLAHALSIRLTIDREFP